MSTAKSDDPKVLMRRLIETTAAGQHRSSESNDGQIIADGLAYLRNLPLPLEGHRMEENDSDQSHLQVGGNPEQYVNLASNYSFSRAFIVSCTGKMGLGPSDTCVGDRICILFGGGVPYVIRKQGTKRVLVGELYLEGVMNGEAIQLDDKSDSKEETFDFI
ncbi:hypothetical protein ACHAPI_009341 [Fusarium lateritium]